jgi:flavorubredoxin
MHAVEIRPDVYWVGALDQNLRDFHGYARAPMGTSYNAYLVVDEKVTLFDTVGARFKDEMLRRIAEVVDPSRIDFLVVNHVELDHSGSLPEVVKATLPERIFCSALGLQALRAHFDTSGWPLEPISDGQEISLGASTVQFMETKMLHWPDSMFSYLPEKRLLVSSDAFGQNIACSERFDDEVEEAILMEQAARYYANIILPFSPLVQKVLADVAARGWQIEMIAPDHGVIWRDGVGRILEAYGRWSAQKLSAKAVLAYDTMWGSTEKMARAIAEGLHAEGLSVKLMSLKTHHHSDVMSEALDAAAILVGSATLNNGIMPSVAGLLTFMKGLKPRGRIGAAFGSYGWSGEAAKIVAGSLEEMKMEVVGPSPRHKYVPRGDDLAACVELGREVGRAARKRLDQG